MEVPANLISFLLNKADLVDEADLDALEAKRLDIKKEAKFFAFYVASTPIPFDSPVSVCLELKQRILMNNRL